MPQYFARSGEFGAPLAAAKATSVVSIQAGASTNIHDCFIAVSPLCYSQALQHKEARPPIFELRSFDPAPPDPPDI
jgi:hypothetical protein